jgi:tetratricopeptide (TPR) repeat protein
MKLIKKIIKNDSEFLFFLILLTTIVYATSWGGEFLSDDILGIQYNTALADFGRQLKTLNFNNIINSLIYKTFGPTPFWFHLVNTIFHLAAVVVVYILVAVLVADAKRLSLEKISKGPAFNLWIPRLTALLFALHPIETEGVAWISGLPYAAYTFFFLLALLFFTLALNKASFQGLALERTAISTSFFILALSSSEKAVIFPIILIAYILLFHKWTKVHFALTVPLFIIAFIYTLSRFADVGGRIESVSPSYAGRSAFFNPLVQIPIAIYSYIKLILWPFNLTLYHEFAAFPQWEYYFAVAVTVLFFLSILYLFWKSKISINKPRGSFNETKLFVRLIVFGLIFFVVSLALTLLPINIAWIVAERYVHLGSFGFFLALSTFIFLISMKLVHKFATFNPYVRKESSKYLAIFLGLFLAFLTIKRNLEWRSQDTLWPATVRESPYSAYAWNNMGDYYGRRADIENSIKAFEQARQLRPRYADATHNLGNTYMQIGEATKAAQFFKEALEYNPTLYQSYENLGKIAIEAKDYKNAQNYFSQAIRLNPNPFADYLNLYIAYDHAGKQKNAQETLFKAKQLAGSNPQRKQIIQELILKLKQEKGEK